MTKYFNENIDIFVDAFFGIDGTLFIPHWFGGLQYELDSENYHDRLAFDVIKNTHECVVGKSVTYWISGNVLDIWTGETRKERAKNFAIWYDKNRGKLPVWSLNDDK